MITNSDYTAHAVYKAARELGLRIGADSRVVGHDDLPTSELLDPPLATLRVDRAPLGRALMAGCWTRGCVTDHVEPVQLVERHSLQPTASGARRTRPASRSTGRSPAVKSQVETAGRRGRRGTDATATTVLDTPLGPLGD